MENITPQKTWAKTSCELSIASCTNCKRHLKRKSIINGTGNFNAMFMWIFFYPSIDEDFFGSPLVGERNVLFRRIIDKADIKFNNLYITHMVKCYAPTKPSIDDIKACFPNVKKEIDCIQPKVVFLEGPDVLKYFANDRKIKLGIKQGALLKFPEFNDIIFVPVFSLDSIYSDSVAETNIVNILKRAVVNLNNQTPQIPKKYIYVKSEEDLDNLFNLLKNVEYLALDIETNGAETFFTTKTVGWSISWKEGYSAYFPWLNDFNLEVWENKERIVKKWDNFLKDKKLILHNGKYDIKILKHDIGLKNLNYYFDTVISSNLLDETQASLSLKNLAYVYTTMGGYDDPLDKIKRKLNIQNDYSQIPRHILWEYACGDTDCTYRIFVKHKKMLKERNLDFLMYQLYMPLSNIFLDLEYRGVYVDKNYLLELKNRYEKELENLSNEIQEIAGTKFLITSGKQLSDILYNKLKLPKVKETKTQASTDKYTLDQLKGKHKIIDLLLEYRKKSTLLKNFVISLLDLLDDKSYVHTEYGVGLQVTSRTCVAKGTPILMPRNLNKYPDGVPIEKIKKGDYVYCYDDTLSLRLGKVVWAGKTGHMKIIRVYWKSSHPIREGYVDVTPDHLIRQLDGSYIRADQLKIGQSVLSLRRNHIITRIEELPDKVDVYDIEVKDYHNFIASEICVHNSSRKPNLQNLPRDDKDIRRAFKARDGYVYVELDFSQIEIRVLAHLSQDPQLIKTLNSGSDIHTQIASEVYGLPIEKITSELRSHSKAVSFGIIYGMSYKTLAKNKNMSERAAKDLYRRFFSTYSGVANWIERVKQYAKQYKKVYTPLMRVRHLDAIDHPIPSIRSSCERCAINSPIQSTAADIANLAFINLLKLYPQEKYDYRFCFQIHDAIILEINKNNILEYLPKFKKVLETTFPLSVKTPVGIKIGPSLGDMVEISDLNDLSNFK